MRKLFVLSFLCLALFSFSQVAQRPDPPKLYNNLSQEYPNFLSASEAESIEQKLETFSKETSNQIVVVIVDDLGGTDASSYATQLGTEWGVGKKDANNGIVVLIKPTERHELFIAIGYGLEGAIPDLATKRIREEEMNPYLKSGDYYSAINNGLDKLMGLAKGEINVKDYASESIIDFIKKHRILFGLGLLVLIWFLSGLGAKGGGGTFSSGRGFYSGGFGGFSGGGGGGSSSSGFGGFGGGSFGGGGSGGSW